MNIHYPETAFSSEQSPMVMGSFFSVLCKLKSNQQILLLRKKKRKQDQLHQFLLVLLTRIGMYCRELSSICRVMDWMI